jgi:hypothetical protein
MRQPFNRRACAAHAKEEIRTHSEENEMKLLCLNSNQLTDSIDGVLTPFFVSAYMRSGMKVATRSLKRTGVVVRDAPGYRDGCAGAFLAMKDSGAELEPDVQAMVALCIRTDIEEVLERYGKAYRRKEPVARTGDDVAILGFNENAFEAMNRGGRTIFFGGTPMEWHYQPVDPALLKCGEPVEVVERIIRAAIVTGVRELMQPQSDAFEQEESVIISLAGNPREVIFKASRGPAQQIWRGESRFTALVRIPPAGLPEVLGEPTIVRDGIEISIYDKAKLEGGSSS